MSVKNILEGIDCSSGFKNKQQQQQNKQTNKQKNKKRALPSGLGKEWWYDDREELVFKENMDSEYGPKESFHNVSWTRVQLEGR